MITAEDSEERESACLVALCSCGDEPVSGFLLNSDPRLLQSGLSVPPGFDNGTRLFHSSASPPERSLIPETPPPEDFHLA